VLLKMTSILFQNNAILANKPIFKKVLKVKKITQTYKFEACLRVTTLACPTTDHF